MFIDTNDIKMDISNRIPPNYSSYETIEITHLLAKKVIEDNIQGDFVECGIAAGNNLAAMCAVGRHGYGFDSFEGIPWGGEFDKEQPGMTNVPAVKDGISSGVSAHSIESAHENFSKWGIENYTLIKGWFSETLPSQKEVDQISILRLDGDMYESTLTSLTYLYPLLYNGGILIIDDWLLTGCQKAVYDYFKDGLPEEKLFFHGVKYFVK